tara:strand:+ start:6758 stop:7039 length:282 start_codon:yes stop_codon:yes gene_type:complete
VKNIIYNIEDKVGKLVKKCTQLSLEKDNLQQNNNILNVQLQEKESEIVALQEKVKLMNISKSVDATKEDVRATRLKINEYVREIDKCIALLNK